MLKKFEGSEHPTPIGRGGRVCQKYVGILGNVTLTVGPYSGPEAPSLCHR